MRCHLNNLPQVLFVGLFLLAILFSNGCDFNFAIGSPSISIKKELFGRWQIASSETGEKEILLVLPLSDKEYLINYPANKANKLYGKAWLIEIDGNTFAQVEWLGDASGKTFDENKNEKRYQLVSYASKDKELAIKLVNPEFIGNKAKTSEELSAFIKANITNKSLYRDPVLFRKISD